MPMAAAIQNGNEIGWQEQHDHGLVILNSSGFGCSGVLLANDWVLTAGHCVSNNRTSPANITSSIVGNGLGVPASQAPGQAVYLFAGFSDEVGPDLALMHLGRPLSVHGSTSGYVGPTFWSGTMGDLGKGTRTVSVYGQGGNSLTSCGNPGATPPVPPSVAGAGTYRSGTVEVGTVGMEPIATPGNISKGPNGGWRTDPNGRYYSLSPHPSVLIPGDSGGPEFIFNPPDTKPYLVGINDSGNCNPPSATIGFTPTSTQGEAVAMPAVRDWIHAVLSSRWDPGSTASNVWVSPPEIDGTRWPVGDVNSAGWAQAARAASAMCYARGFAGGHFDGHQGQLDGRTGAGILCSSSPTAVWFDVTRSQFPKDWDFKDVNAVSWAQAGRAAAGICGKPPDGSAPFLGGQFNGHMRSIVGRPTTFGVFCYRSGQFFDARDDQMPGAWPINTADLDHAPWAQAARAAVDFCRGRGFAGGFMTGHHVPNRTGIVCQK